MKHRSTKKKQQRNYLHWLESQGREEETRQAILRLRGELEKQGS